MKLGKRSEKKKENNRIQKFILYFLILAFSLSLVSSIVISLILVGSERDLSLNIKGIGSLNTELPVLGQFGPISTVILLIGFPLLLLLTLVAYSFYISMSGIKNKLDIF